MKTAELFDFVRRAGTERSTAKIFAELTRFVGRSFGAHRISLYLVEGDDIVPFVSEFASEPDDAAAHARWRDIGGWRPPFLALLRAGAPSVRITDPRGEVDPELVTIFGIRPFTALALTSPSGLLGVLVVEGDPDRLAGAEPDLVELAGFVTLALENAQAFEEQELRRRGAEAFAAISAALAESDDPARVLARVARDAAELAGFDRGTILLFEDGAVVPAMSQFAGEREEHEQWQAFQALSKESFDSVLSFSGAHDGPVAVESRAELAEVMGGDIVELFGLGSALLLPLSAWGESLGMLVLDRRAEGPIEPELLRLAEGMAAPAAVAIGVSRMLARERDLVAELRTLDDTKTTFIATISHELRTPLTSIIGFAEMLTEIGTSDEEREFSGYIVRESRYLENLIGNLLDSSRIEAGRLSLDRHRIDLGAVVRDAVDLVGYVFPARQADLDITAAPLPVDGDPGRLRQVVTNLVENAAKYSRPGDPITVEASGDGDTVRVTVEDGGPGIPAAEREAVFDRFHRLQGSGQNGTGIGLFLVRQLVDAHGGRVWCEAGAGGRGIRFVVELPAAD